MQQFKALAKKMGFFAKKYSAYLFSVLKTLCKNLIPSVTNSTVAYLKKSPRTFLEYEVNHLFTNLMRSTNHCFIYLDKLPYFKCGQNVLIDSPNIPRIS